MLVKVFIRRPMKDGKVKEAFTLLKKLRSIAVKHKGYISGETLVSTEDPKEIMVISTWQSMEDWNSWKNNKDRKAIDDTSFEITKTNLEDAQITAIHAINQVTQTSMNGTSANGKQPDIEQSDSQSQAR